MEWKRTRDIYRGGSSRRGGGGSMVSGDSEREDDGAYMERGEGRRGGSMLSRRGRGWREEGETDTG